jgi:hypothetical protein
MKKAIISERKITEKWANLLLRLNNLQSIFTSLTL